MELEGNGGPNLLLDDKKAAWRKAGRMTSVVEARERVSLRQRKQLLKGLEYSELSVATRPGQFTFGYLGSGCPRTGSAWRDTWIGLEVVNQVLWREGSTFAMRLWESSLVSW